MNRRELRDAFRRDARDRADPPLWEDRDVNAWLDEAQEEACIRARLLDAWQEFDVAAGDAEVPLARSRIFEVKKVVFAAAGERARELRQADQFEDGNPRPDCGPQSFVHRDGRLVLDSPVISAGLVEIEGFRLPCHMASDEACPDIAPIHHRRLVHWALFRAYSVPDADGADPEKAAEHEVRFERYFGRRPTADLRKRQAASAPHHNKCWW